MAGVSVAKVSAAPLGAWIRSTASWRLAFYLTGSAGAAALVVQLATIPPLPAARSASLSTFAAVLRRPATKRSLLSTFCIAGGHFAAFTYIRPFLETVSRLDAAARFALLLAFGVAGFFGNLLGGAVSQRSARVAIAAAGTEMAWAIGNGVCRRRVSPHRRAALNLWGLAFGAYPVSIQTLLTRAAPNDAESIGAVHLSVFMIAVSCGAFLGGELVDRFCPRRPSPWPEAPRSWERS